jgi:hypothetical protein
MKREHERGVERLVARVRGADDLDQRQHRRRVEEVQPDDALRGPGRVGDLRHRKRRGVRGEDRGRRQDAVELAEELALDVEVLERGLDHELAAGKVGELSGEREAPEGRVLLVLREAFLLDPAREVVVDAPARGLAELERHIAADDLETGLEADLRNPGTHRAEPDYADASDLHGARS